MIRKLSKLSRTNVMRRMSKIRAGQLWACPGNPIDGRGKLRPLNRVGASLAAPSYHITVRTVPVHGGSCHSLCSVALNACRPISAQPYLAASRRCRARPAVTVDALARGRSFSISCRAPSSAPLPLGESLMIAWPQSVVLVASTIVLFVASYVVFQRQEVRA